MNRVLLFGIGTVVTLLALFVAAVFVIDAGKRDVIADGVRIGTLDVGGLERDQARELVRRELTGSVGKSVTATHGNRRFVLKPERAKARLDVDATVDAAIRRSREGTAFSRVLFGEDVRGTVTPRVAFSRAAVEDFATRVARRVGRPARDADIAWHDGKIERTRALKGIQVKKPDLLATLVSVMSNPAAQRTVKVPVTVTERADRNLQDLAKRYPTVIAVDRDAKVLRLYKHLLLDKRYKIAVGQAGLETAAGRYEIADKQVNPAWHVPMSDWAGDLAGRTIPPGDPQNPLEARWMGFHDGQGIHGTADLASLGTAASHGCIRMSVPAVKQLFREVKVGTPLFLQ